MRGFLGHLSAEQEEALNDLRQRVSEIEDEEMKEYAKRATDDAILLRFLRARRFDVDQAYEMIFNTLKFRLTFQGIGVEAVNYTHVPNELKPGKSFFHKYDKEGRPVCIIRARHHDGSKIDHLEAQRFCVFMMEYGRTLLKPGIETVTIIFDMTDAAVKNLDLKSLKFMIQMFQNHYPESLGRILVYNSPWFVWGTWKLIRPLLDPVTAAKVCFTDNREILHYISQEDLLEEYGGKDPYQYDCDQFIMQLKQVMHAAQ
jgi:hypothetical protein